MAARGPKRGGMPKLSDFFHVPVKDRWSVLVAARVDFRMKAHDAGVVEQEKKMRAEMEAMMGEWEAAKGNGTPHPADYAGKSRADRFLAMTEAKMAKERKAKEEDTEAVVKAGKRREMAWGVKFSAVKRQEQLDKQEYELAGYCNEAEWFMARIDAQIALEKRAEMLPDRLLAGWKRKGSVTQGERRYQSELARDRAKFKRQAEHEERSLIRAGDLGTLAQMQLIAKFEYSWFMGSNVALTQEEMKEVVEVLQTQIDYYNCRYASADPSQVDHFIAKLYYARDVAMRRLGRGKEGIKK